MRRRVCAVSEGAAVPHQAGSAGEHDRHRCAAVRVRRLLAVLLVHRAHGRSCGVDADYVAFLTDLEKDREALPSAEVQLERQAAEAAGEASAWPLTGTYEGLLLPNLAMADFALQP